MALALTAHCCSGDHIYNLTCLIMFTQVWLKHDLRLDDHPGFMQAADFAGLVVPFFCLVPTLYVHLLRTPNGIDGKECHERLATRKVLSATTLTGINWNYGPHAWQSVC